VHRLTRNAEATAMIAFWLPIVWLLDKASNYHDSERLPLLDMWGHAFDQMWSWRYVRKGANPW
jgi:hypothetical protein